MISMMRLLQKTKPFAAFVVVIGKEGKMTSDAGPKYEGLDRYECRKRVVIDLKTLQFVEKGRKTPPCSRTLLQVQNNNRASADTAVVCECRDAGKGCDRRC